MTDLPAGEVLWTPSELGERPSIIGGYMEWLRTERGLDFTTYEQLWEWSVGRLDEFWRSIWDYYAVSPGTDPGPVLVESTMPDAVWFPEAKVNYAEHALTHDDQDQVVLVAESQTRAPQSLTRGQLAEEVRRVSAGLLRLGVGTGDRVAAYLPNIPEAAIAFLATASIGAIWAVCPPEFGTQSVLERFEQIEPKVLFVVDGYRYGEKVVDRTTQVAKVRAKLPSLVATVSIAYLDPEGEPAPGATPWSELRAEDAPARFERLPFDHPLWILFSSGTTGLPKAIVHGHGGILIEHLKTNGIQMDMGPDDRFFFFSTTAWMVWNRAVSNLLVGGSFAIYDGDPTYPDTSAMFDFVARAGVTVWGVSATYLMKARTDGIRFADFDFSRVKAIVGAGSPVPIEGYRYVYDQVAPHVHFYSGSGGTDVCSSFVTGSTMLPVTAGEIPARALGVLALAYDDEGNELIDEAGELVITKPMPSMPLYFWGDPGKERYTAAYFDRYPGVWRHGDHFVVSSRGTCGILGRSDATLNRGGVRLGSGEIYSVVEDIPGVRDSLAVHLDDSLGMGELLLFVVLAPGVELDDELVGTIKSRLRDLRSPRHVPDSIHVVHAIPRTLTGKKMEVPVKKILTGAVPSSVASPTTMADPSAIDDFVALANTRT
jgi:acetoacetyl-CoA synthetase